MLAKRAERLNKRTKGTEAYGVIDWIALLPTFLSLLSLCKKPVDPAPVNPTPNPSSAQSAAWNDAWGLKSAATDNWDGTAYRQATINNTARHIRKSKRRDGNPIKMAEARTAAIAALDEARASEMPDLYADVCEARHVA